MLELTLEEMVILIDEARKNTNISHMAGKAIPIEDILIEILSRIQALEKAKEPVAL
ncbi:MAG: hypothetical protein IID32_00245 [Planctomycetes bacterium]|nr:hypothetical protein [Planctomycetota bacterium]